MNAPIKFNGYTTHDPYQAEQLYQNKHGKKPKLLLIRPEYPVTKDHPLLVESAYCGANIVMVTHILDAAQYNEIYNQREEIRRERRLLETSAVDPVAPKKGNGRDRPKVVKKEIKSEWVRKPPKILTDREYLVLLQVPGFVYMLKSENGYHKIGRSIDVEYRRIQIERDIPLIINIEHYFATNHYIAAEAYMHRKYDSKRVKYEWFRLSDRQMREFKSVQDYDLDGMIERRLLEERDTNQDAVI